jgi:hypothetical protein
VFRAKYKPQYDLVLSHTVTLKFTDPLFSIYRTISVFHSFKVHTSLFPEKRLTGKIRHCSSDGAVLLDYLNTVLPCCMSKFINYVW